MKLEVDPGGVWYHGSDKAFDVLREGSTITQWQALARAFSHQPTLLCTEDDGSIWHNGQKAGWLYAVDEPVALGKDCYPHPRTAMEPLAEFVTTRPLRVRAIAPCLAAGAKTGPGG